MERAEREHALINVGVGGLPEACATLGLHAGGLAAAAATSLLLHGNCIAALTPPAHLALPALRALNLSSNEVSYADCGELAAFAPALEHLDLAANRVCGVRGLSTLRRLSSLNLAFNALTDLRWLAELAGSAALERLDLRDNALEDPSELFALRHAPGLRELRLRSAQLERGARDGTVRVTSSAANPMCARPTYLPILLAACPALQLLDGVPVAQWRECLQAVQAHAALLAAAATPYTPPGAPPAPAPPHVLAHLHAAAATDADAGAGDAGGGSGARSQAPADALSLPRVDGAGRRFLARFLGAGATPASAAAAVAREVQEAAQRLQEGSSAGSAGSAGSPPPPSSASTRSSSSASF
jgi:hypothetical protein